MAPKKHVVEIYGLMKEAELYQAKVTAEGLYQKQKDDFEEPKIVGMIENEWAHFLQNTKQKYGGELWSYKKITLAILDGQVLGSAEEFMNWAKTNYDYEDFRPLPLFYALAKEEYKVYMQSKKHDFVYLEVSIDGKKEGTMIVELFNDMLPKTCENFKQLCIGGKSESTNHTPALDLTYKGNLFHRVVKNGWLQAGDIVGGKGDGGWSIYGETFEDENYSVLHDRRGILGMANKGRHSNSSQFYITLQPAAWMDHEYVAFGEVVEGLALLERLENVETYNERPLKDCVIAECGVFDVDLLYT